MYGKHNTNIQSRDKGILIERDAHAGTTITTQNGST